jgi:RNA polymerase sigma-70 factor, ECF subfamily
MLMSEQLVLKTLMQWRSRISAAAWLVVRNSHTAEDIFQNIVVKAMTREVTFESEAALVSWAFIATRREAIDWLAKHKRESPILDDELLEILDKSWQSRPVLSAGTKLDALQDYIESAPVESQSLLQLRYGHNHTCEEIADKMKLKLNAVYKRLSRLHENLKQCIKDKMRKTSRFGGLSE